VGFEEAKILYALKTRPLEFLEDINKMLMVVETRRVYENRAAQIQLFTDGNPAVRKLLEDYFAKERLSDAQTELVDRRCKLRPEQVSEMRRAYDTDKPSMRQLAKRYSVSVSTVSNIVHGFYWEKLT
jgi:hypothetical protein